MGFKLISRALITVLLSSFLAGIVVSGIQMIGVNPLIIEAENLEIDSSDLSINQESHSWTPEEGFERTFYTSISNILSGFAFSLMLVAIFLLRGKPVSFSSGFFWGMAGFFVFSLAPSFGLPPELPGKSAAVLENRQLWWIFTVVCSATAIGFFTESKSIVFKILAMMLLLLPHIIGPPNPHLFETIIPKELASKFIFASLLTSAFFWGTLGVTSGYLYKKWVHEFTITTKN